MGKELVNEFGRFVVGILTAVVFLATPVTALATDKGQDSPPEVKSLAQAAGYLCEQKCKKEAKTYGEKSDDHEEKSGQLKDARGAGTPPEEIVKLERELAEERVFLEKARAEYVDCLKGCRDKKSKNRREKKRRSMAAVGRQVPPPVGDRLPQEERQAQRQRR